MIRLLTAWTRITVVAVSMAMSIPAITFAQTPESATESEPAAGDNANPVQAASGPEDNTSVETNPPARSTIPSEVEAENQRRINEPQDWLSNVESWSTIIRNFGLIIAAVIALWFARRRILVADRQAATTQRGLLNERYQKGAEMLGNKVLAVRLGGIYALSRLAREHPGDYHTQIMRLLCAFVRNPPEAEKEDQGTNKLSEDILVTVSSVRGRSEAQIKIEKKEKYRLGLSGTNLCGVYLSKANLSYAYLIEANLSRALLLKLI